MEPLVHSVDSGPASTSPRAPGSPAERALSREEKDFLNEHITEAEVFVKYGLYDKAIEPLQTVLGRFPGHLEAHQRLKAIYSEQGNRARFIERCLAIADIHEREGHAAEAVAVLVEARNLDADNAIIRGRLDRLDSATRSHLNARHAEPSPAPSRSRDVEIDVDEDAG